MTVIERRPSTARIASVAAALCAVAVARAEEQGGAEAASVPPPYEEGIVVEAPPRLLHGRTGGNAGTVEILEGEQLRASGARTLQDALQALSTVHLVDQQGSSHQQDLVIRGFTATSVTGVPQGLSVFLDGVRVNEPAVEEVNFDLVPLADVERIEIVHGPQAIFGRNTLGGAVHILTRRGGERTDGEVEVEGGSAEYRAAKARVSGSLGPLDAYFGAEQSYDAGWRARSASRIGHVFGKLGLRTPDTDATLSYQFQHDELHEPGSLPLSLLEQDRTQNYTPGDFFRPDLHLVTLNGLRRLAPGLSVTGNAFFRALDVQQFNASYVDADTRLFNVTRSAGATAQLDHRASLGALRNQLSAGGEATRSSVRITVHQEPNAANPAEPGAPPSPVSSDVSDAQLAAGAFVQDQLRVTRGPLAGVAVTGALRLDWIAHDIVDASPEDPGKATGRATYTSLVPALGVRWALAPRWVASASYSGGFRAPAFLELTCADVNAPCIGLQSGVAPDTSFTPLRGVRARSLEAGLSGSPLDGVTVALTVFRVDLHNDIFAITLPSTTQVVFRNVGDTRRQGAELKARAAAGPVALEGSYAFTLSTFQDDVPDLATPRTGTENVARGAELPMSPHHRAGLGARVRPLPWLELSTAMKWVSPQYYLGDEENAGPRLPSYFVLGAGAEARWQRWAAFVRASNVLGSRYEVFGTYAVNAKAGATVPERFLTPGPPLWIVAGLRWELE